MLVSAMGAMMEGVVGPMGINHVSSKPPAGGRKLTRTVFRQMRRDFFVASPFVLHAGVPELLAGTWSLVRETLFTGEVPRGQKEVVAWAVSKANQCPFCVGAHHAAVIAAKAEEEDLQAWAEATGWARDPGLAHRPFLGNEAEFFGTVVAFHYLNRMVSVFLDEKMMPTPSFMDGIANAMARIMMGGMIRKGKKNNPGDSLAILPEWDESLAWRPDWAADSESISGALAGWSAILEGAAREHLDAALIEALSPVFDRWQGGDPGLGDAWLEDLRPEVAESLEPMADIALLTVMAPYMVDESRVNAVLDKGATKQQLLVVVAWAASRAARRAGEWSAAAGARQEAHM